MLKNYLVIMFNRKTLLALMVVILLNGCTSPSAMIGPVYTLSSTGNTFQAGLSYGSNELITQYTGKTPIENLKELRVIEENKTQNIKKETLESEDFYVLIKKEKINIGGNHSELLSRKLTKNWSSSFLLKFCHFFSVLELCTLLT